MHRSIVAVALGLVVGVWIAVAPRPASADADVAEPEDEGWIALFDGETLDGWDRTGNAEWSVEDGILVGKQGPDGAPGDIWTREAYKDFELECTFKVIWPANSGIWFRSDQSHGKLGYQVDILRMEEYGCTVGTIYSDGFLSQNKDQDLVRLDDWNTVKLTARGYHFRVVLNGHEVGDVTDEQSRYAEGRIGFQVHAGDQYKDMRIMVKELKLRPLED
ncbi:MAG TPA: DUF1080 domain-containing protein [Armatimonadota bacterium]|nr:DUF1080 domain-containing protein [Armatimonadota bacterium]HQK93986.1 DUF1080 domain-containing protein [Armatimonadota bacterium]